MKYCSFVFVSMLLSEKPVFKMIFQQLPYLFYYLLFQSELEFQRLQWKKEGRTTKEKAKLYFIRLIVNILVIAVLSGSLYLIYVCFTNDNLLKVNIICQS